MSRDKKILKRYDITRQPQDRPIPTHERSRSRNEARIDFNETKRPEKYRVPGADTRTGSTTARYGSTPRSVRPDNVAEPRWQNVPTPDRALSVPTGRLQNRYIHLPRRIENQRMFPIHFGHPGSFKNLKLVEFYRRQRQGIDPSDLVLHHRTGFAG